jgi:hypothetical protein
VHHPSVPVSCNLLCAAGPVGRTSSYKYLGWLITDSSVGDWEKDLSMRIRNAWAIARSFSKLWTSYAPRSVKLRLLQALVIPSLLYSAFTYPRTLAAMTRLHVACNKLIRYALGIRVEWDDPSIHVSTDELYSEYPFLPVAVAQHLLGQWGHWVRMQSSRGVVPPAVSVLLSDPETRKFRGKNWPPSRILESVAGPATPLDVLESLPMNRRRWKKYADERTRELASEFVGRVVLPRSLSRGHGSNCSWPVLIERWFRDGETDT